MFGDFHNFQSLWAQCWNTRATGLVDPYTVFSTPMANATTGGAGAAGLKRHETSAFEQIVDSEMRRQNPDKNRMKRPSEGEKCRGQP